MAPPVMVASFFLLPWAGRPLQFFTILAGLERIGHHLVRALEVAGVFLAVTQTGDSKKD